MSDNDFEIVLPGFSFTVSHNSWFIIAVPDYKIAVVRPHRTRRGISDGRKQYKLYAFDEKLHLMLEPNDEVVSQSLVVMKKLPGNIWTQELYTPEGRFLQGHVVSDPNSHVAVRELKRDKEIVS